MAIDSKPEKIVDRLVESGHSLRGDAGARNILIDPRHPAAGELSIEHVCSWPFDRRLKR